MKSSLGTWLGVMLVATIAGWSESADGRGGRGGGGGFRGGGGGGGNLGGGGGGARPGGGNFGGGGGGFSGGGGAKPNLGSAPSFNRPAENSRPNLPSTRPSSPGSNIGARPNIHDPGFGGGLEPGSRPNLGGGGGSGIGNLPATRPGAGIGAGQGIGSGAGIGSRPGVGPGGITNRPGAGDGLTNRPGIGTGIGERPSQLPGRLPGLGAEGNVGSRLPNQGARVQDRLANTPLEDRRSNLSDRMSNGREDWQQHRQNLQGDRQDWRDNHREDWQNWGDNKLEHYGDWYHGCWHPGSGWGYMWDNYPAAAAIGMTAWTINRIGYGWGYYNYVNPYYSAGAGYGYNYSEPLVVYAAAPATATTTTAAAAAASVSPSQPQPTDEGMAAFDQARAAFQQGDYSGALTQLDTTLKTMPRDTVVHEFRGLVLFALKQYPESAAAIYAVLSAGPGWDWTTMISLYPSAETYTTQVRALEEFVKANPQSPDGHFLIGYHYQTMGHTDDAAKQFKKALTLLPEDKLLKQLVAMTSPQDKTAKPDTSTPPPAVGDDTSLSTEQLVGTWLATTGESKFELDLSKNGGFTWTFSKGQGQQAVTGVFAIDKNNLALETDDGGGTMLAAVRLADPRTLNFKMVGDDPKDPGLEFKKR